MTRSMTTAVLAALLPAASTPAHDGEHGVTAQICNKTDGPVWGAIGYRDDGEWYSEGWFSVGESECRDILPNVLGPIYFIAAANTQFVEKHHVWRPDEGYPTRLFCIHRFTGHDFVYVDEDCDDPEPAIGRERFGRVIDLDGDGIARFNVREHQ